MKFLCLDCDEAMDFGERQLPGDGTLAAVFVCPGCDREMALLTNPMETRVVSSMGVKIGGREVPEQPMELLRSNLDGARPDVFVEDGAEGESPPPAGDPGGEASPDDARARPRPDPTVNRPNWTPEAVDRLGRVPRFVRGMVKRIYSDYARERSIEEITPEVMDQARTDLGLEGM